MAKEFKVKVRLQGKDEASDDIKRVEGGFSRLKNAMGKGFLVATAAAAAGIALLVKTFKSAIAAAQVQEDAIKKLDTALNSLGPAAAGVSKRLQEYAAELQKVTRFGDEQIIQGQALIASFTKNEEEIKKATVAALNLSAAIGTDLNAAFLLLAKAAAGETASLSRYGIILDKSIPASDKFAAVLKKINTQFGGFAAREVDTYSGAMQQASNAFGDLLEKLGFAITQNPTVVKGLTKIKDVLSSGKLVELVEKLADGVASFVSGAIDWARGIFIMVKALKELDDKTTRVLSSLGFLVGLMADFVKLLSTLPRALGQQSAAQDESNKATKEAGEALFELTTRQQTLAVVQRLGTDLLGGYFEAQRLANEAAKDGAIDLEKLAKAAQDAADSYENAVESAKAFGVTTSVELEGKLFDIAQALFNQKQILGENSLEYQKMAEVAAEATARIQARIDSLRQGLGDLKAATTETGDAVKGFGGDARDTEPPVVELTGAINDLKGANDKLIPTFNEINKVIAVTSAGFDALAASAGRAAAIQAALAGGARLTSGGTRIRFAGGGSRLTSTAGFGSSTIGQQGTFTDFNLSGGTFTTVSKTVTQSPDGRIEFI